jgi:uncharacterized membrane protein
VGVSPASGTYATGEVVRTRVTIENTGGTRHTFFVGYDAAGPNGGRYNNDRTTGTSVTLAPDEQVTVTVEWTVEQDAPDGPYGVVVALWAGNADALGERLDIVEHGGVFEVGGGGSGVAGRIVDVSLPSGSYRPGDVVRTAVTVRNTGGTSHTFFVGYDALGPNGGHYNNDRTTGRSVALAPGETRTVTVEWTVEDRLPSGRYGVLVVLWREGDPEALETRLDAVERHGVFAVR